MGTLTCGRDYKDLVSVTKKAKVRPMPSAIKGEATEASRAHKNRSASSGEGGGGPACYDKSSTTSEGWKVQAEVS